MWELEINDKKVLKLAIYNSNECEFLINTRFAAKANIIP